MFGFNRPYVRNPSAIFTPVYIPGENSSFYFNCEQPIDDVDYADFEFWVLNPDGSQNILIGTVSILLIAGTVGYAIYVNDFVFPHIPDGQYYLQIYNSNTDNEVFRSNLILVDTSENTIYRTTPVKFRHNDQLFGVRYDLLPDFYQKFRLPFNQIKAPEIRSERMQYRQSSNGRELRNSKSFRDIVLTLEFYYGEDSDIGAVSAMLEHTEIWISGNRVTDQTQIKPEKNSEFNGLEKGTFEVIVNDYGANPRSLEYFGDVIFWGGVGNNIINTFVQG